MNRVFAHTEGVSTFASYGAEWIVLLVPFIGLAAVIGALWRFGRGSGFFSRIGNSLERATNLPSWSASGVGMGMFALAVAVIGFYWDVSWHIEKGRDEFIFTPAHMGILFGLGFIVVAGVTSVIFATLEKADAGIRVRNLQVPFGAIGLLLLGVGALTGFPLDEFWHKAYGIDVTMWGPTHLVMISGASLTPIALWILVGEARKKRPEIQVPAWISIFIAGALVTGLSTWTGEFDFGVPQFQQLYHPVLVMIAASISLTMSRQLLGPGGAIKAALSFLAIRSVVAVLLGGGLGILLPRFPLYLVAALLVEASARRSEKSQGFASVVRTGLLIGTIGLAAEWAWMQVWGWHPWGPSLFPSIVVAVLVAIPGAVLGTEMGDIIAGREGRFGRATLLLAGAGIVASLVIPFPRNSATVESVVTTEPAGPGRVAVTIALEPKDAAEPADWFEVQSWQGGALQNTPLEEIAPGTYTSTRPVPADGDWKSFIRIAKKDVMIAVPVYLPADPAIGASEIPLLERREASFQRDTELLLREAREGSAAPAILAYTAILLLTLTWIAGLTFCFAKVAGLDRRNPPQGEAQRSVRRREGMAVS